jgi:uncharacterized protein
LALLSPSIEGFKRLDRLTRTVERERSPLADFDAALEHERKISPSLGGRMVFDDNLRRERNDTSGQLSLF